MVEPAPLEQILRDLDLAYWAARELSGIEFALDRQDRHTHANSHSFYMRYTGPLPAGGSVKVDITIREHLAFPLDRRPVLRAYEEFADLPDDRPVLLYTLSEIASEKAVALVDQARNEPRDLYDLWYLVSHGGIDLARLGPAIAAKLAFRDKPVSGLQGAILKKEARLKALWSVRLASQMVSLPPFEQVFREFRRALRQADLP